MTNAWRENFIVSRAAIAARRSYYFNFSFCQPLWHIIQFGMAREWSPKSVQFLSWPYIKASQSSCPCYSDIYLNEMKPDIRADLYCLSWSHWNENLYSIEVSIKHNISDFWIRTFWNKLTIWANNLAYSVQKHRLNNQTLIIHDQNMTQ